MDTLQLAIICASSVCGVGIVIIGALRFMRMKQDELNYREELRTQKAVRVASIQYPTAGSAGNEESGSELSSIMGLLSDPSIQGLIKSFMEQKTKEPGNVK
jgi:hypothetical protein